MTYRNYFDGLDDFDRRFQEEILKESRRAYKAAKEFRYRAAYSGEYPNEEETFAKENATVGRIRITGKRKWIVIRSLGKVEVLQETRQ